MNEILMKIYLRQIITENERALIEGYKSPEALEDTAEKILKEVMK